MNMDKKKLNPQNAINHYRQNQEHYLSQLEALTRIPSVSFPGYPALELEKSADFVSKCMKDYGLQNVQVLKIKGAHPYVYGEWVKDKTAPTVLLYAHHDVQPPMRDDIWESPAFTPTRRGDRIYARGIADDKAGIMLHLASINSWLKAHNSLPLNIKVLIEGEEETGSAHLEEFLNKHAQLLKAQCLIIADAANIDTGLPSITTSLRGLVTFEVTASATRQPLHSGLWGGPVPDPVAGLCRLLNGLVDESGKPALKDLWQDVIPPTPGELRDLKNIPISRLEFSKQAGLLEGVRLHGLEDDLFVKTWREPSLIINSIESGGKKIAGNVIMDSAWARVGLRIVPDMQPERCRQIIEDYLIKNCPWGLKLETKWDSGVSAWVSDTNHPAFTIAKESLKLGYQTEPLFTGCGASIPFVESLGRVLGHIPALLVGVEDPYTQAHSENESLYLPDFHKAVESQIHFFSLFSSYSGLEESD